MVLKDIKGIGPKTEELFHKVGIFTPDDLVRYYPVGYEEYTEPCRVSDVVGGAKNAVSAVLIKSPVMRSFKRISILTTEAADESGTLRMIWFNAQFLSKMLKKGSRYVFRGVVKEKNGQRVMEHPEIFSAAKYEELQNTLVPVYGLTKGLSGKTIAKAVRSVFELDPTFVNEFLPESLIRLHGLMDEREAVRRIHFPENRDDYLEARRRIVFDEFFLFILGVRMMKMSEQEARNEFPMSEVWETEEVIAALPFKLTQAQLRVWHEIEHDLKSEKLMSRLVQGDVGSGKTIISFLAMILTAENGYQSSLMAPTEVLAKQHYEKLCRLKLDMGIESLRPILLTGSMRAAERRDALAAIESGAANAIVGTHALIQERVRYHSLALVITDEQHRFGVRQRKALTEMGAEPNAMVMSATPIPRTLGVIYYGDLDISVIDELPARRLPIKTAVVGEDYRDNALRFIGRQVSEGRQAYVICPMIEESEEFDAPDVMTEAKGLREHFPDLKIDILHGRMKADEKDDVMERFSRAETNILVSTTVIEVGVDVPNATVMLILGAERFGLAQLHQLRGRVGRGEFQSYCIFMAGHQSEAIKERLSILQESTDGFRIAEKDFELRGPGDLLGIRQSGDAMFRIADVTRDGTILKLAGETAAAIIADDPALLNDEHASLKMMFEHYLESGDRTIVL